MSDIRIVAEAGPCNGDLDYAAKAAVAAASAGAWGFKVQMYTADTLVQPWASRYAHLFSKHDTQYGDFSKTIDYADWKEVKQICDDYEMEFFASCFDRAAVDACEEMEVNFYKIASGEITNTPLLNYIGTTRKEIILSTGASYTHEIDDAIEALDYPDLTLLACSLEYPATDGLMDRINYLQGIYEYPIGYSDHTLGVESMWISVALGASMHEVHFTITPGEGGDHDMGVTPPELQEMSYIANRAEALIWTPSDALAPTAEEARARTGARRGVYWARDMRQGEEFGLDDIKILRPNYAGIKPVDATDMLGGTLTRDVKVDDPWVTDDVTFEE